MSARYSTAATVPAWPSKFWVPVSKRWPAGRTLYAGRVVEDVAPAVDRADVRPEELVDRARDEVGADGARVERQVRRGVDRVDVDPGARGVGARSAISAIGLIVPTAFDAQPTATSRVRSLSTASRSSSRSVQSSSAGSQVRTTTSLSRAAAIHGSTFAWWSRPVTTISSPGRIAAAIERDMWKVIVVMFGPRVISSASTPRRSAIAWCASSTIASERSEVGKAPPWLAFDSR